MSMLSFLRFSDEEKYLIDFVKNGHVFINPVKYFIDCEIDDSGRNDYFEFAVVREEPVSVTIGERKFEVVPNPKKPALLREGYTHLFCLYGLSEDSLRRAPGRQAFNNCLWEEFGNYFVLIHKPDVFLERLFQALEKEDYSYGLVEYIDFENYDGDGGAFKKSIEFSHQEEYRVAIANPSKDKPLEGIFLGDISDIAYGPLHKSKSINKYDLNANHVEL